MIEGTSEIVRIPRLGKIHLGVKAISDKSGAEYPRAVDYFVVPEEVQAIYGIKPKELDIMFPLEDENQFAPQFLKCYSQSQGLVCKGDGAAAWRKVDLATGDIASGKTADWDWREIPCNMQDCPEYLSKKCRRVMSLMFLLPKVEGLGCWQIDTSSFNSIVNVNSMVKLLRGILGRCSMIPLTLVLQPRDVSPKGEKKKTVHVMNIKQNIKLSSLAQIAQLPPGKVFMPEVSDEAPTDLFPWVEDTEDVAAVVNEEPKEEVIAVVDEKPKEVVTEKKPAPKPKEKPTPKPKVEPPEADKRGETVVKAKIMTEANSISPNYYKSVIHPRMRVTFGADIEQLDLTQLNTALQRMIAKASEDDKRAFINGMHNYGYTDSEEIKRFLIETTGTSSGWTMGDMDKTLLAASNRPGIDPPTTAGQGEVQQFLAEFK